MVGIQAPLGAWVGNRVDRPSKGPCILGTTTPVQKATASLDGECSTQAGRQPGEVSKDRERRKDSKAGHVMSLNQAAPPTRNTRKAAHGFQCHQDSWIRDQDTATLASTLFLPQVYCVTRLRILPSLVFSAHIIRWSDLRISTAPILQCIHTFHDKSKPGLLFLMWHLSGSKGGNYQGKRTGRT